MFHGDSEALGYWRLDRYMKMMKKIKNKKKYRRNYKLERKLMRKICYY